MKKIASVLFLALFCLASGVMDAQTDKVVRILSIGNSFSADAVEQHLHDIAAADGQDILLVARLDSLGGGGVVHLLHETLGEGAIVAVFQKGYRKGDHIIRYAMVQVAN
mgnify:CR=1 FL=1